MADTVNNLPTNCFDTATPVTYTNGTYDIYANHVNGETPKATPVDTKPKKKKSMK